MNPRGKHFSGVSFFGLNLSNFFQAEMVGVILPILGAFLKDHHWRYDSIGMATAAAGLGTMLMQTPAGMLSDRICSRRFLFAACAVLTGAGFTVLASVADHHRLVHGLLFLVGAVQSFFGPLLGALALALVGHDLLNKTAGTNQGWNHAGNIAAALSAIALVRFLGLSSIFYSMGASSLAAAASVLFIRPQDLDERTASGLTEEQAAPVPLDRLIGDRTVLVVFIAVFLFHLSNAPILPLTALYVKQLGGSDGLMTATVLSAQVVMVPVALLAGRYGDRWGHKPVLAIAFWILPLRILSYAFAHKPEAIVWLQCLDGIGAGIYGVVVISLAADLTRGRGRFNALAGLFATAVSVGGVAGPAIGGVVVQHFGFKFAFAFFAALALAGAAIFTLFVPETKKRVAPGPLREKTSPQSVF